MTDACVICEYLLIYLPCSSCWLAGWPTQMKGLLLKSSTLSWLTLPEGEVWAQNWFLFSHKNLNQWSPFRHGTWLFSGFWRLPILPLCSTARAWINATNAKEYIALDFRLPWKTTNCQLESFQNVCMYKFNYTPSVTFIFSQLDQASQNMLEIN